MHTVTFYPIGNADSCTIVLSGGEWLQFDFADMHDRNDPDDRRIPLSKTIREALLAAGRTSIDVLGLTHLDNDHISGVSQFFWLQHAKSYQSEDRIKIDELWVPAAVIVEDDCKTEDARAVRAEAHHRLKNKKGIRVFSRPQVLESWLKQQDMTLAEVQHLITDAGRTVPGWTKEQQGVEFFIHSPFATRTNEGEVVDRNNDALFFQATFKDGGRESKLILSADVDSDVIEDIVRVTRDVKKRPERLEWDLNNVPHHSSYRSLNKDDKGEDMTAPPEPVDWLYQPRQARPGGYLVSTSHAIPTEDTDQPPHRQAAAYYRARVQGVSGEYRVTMEFPSADRPDKMVFEIDKFGVRLLKQSSRGSLGIVTTRPPRAG